MKFDTTIIGGGLSGLVCGIQLAEQGQKCAIVSSGQSALHFFSGSFDLFGSLDGQEVASPLDVLEQLPDVHPYSRVGANKISRFGQEAPLLLNRAGVSVAGSCDKNHFVLTPMGTMKPTWLTMDDFTTFERKSLPYRNAVIVTFSGFLDFHTLFVQDGLKDLGVEASIQEVSMKQLEQLRKNPSEMRSSNIARVFDQDAVVNEFTQKVNKLAPEADLVVLPALFGLFNGGVVSMLKTRMNRPVMLLPVVPPSPPGIRAQELLRKRFQALGGTYLLGDMVEGGALSESRLFRVQTKNHGDIEFKADNFVLASGHFYSKGIVAAPDRIFEPTFDLDIYGDDDRSNWFDKQVFNDQPFMHFGVKTDSRFRAVKDGKVIENLYVAGSVLGGANPLKEGSGAGICIITALHAAEQILLS